MSEVVGNIRRRLTQSSRSGRRLAPACYPSDELTAARDALTARGVTLGDVDDFGGVLYSRFEDPDGSSWLLQQWGEGGFPHESLSKP